MFLQYDPLGTAAGLFSQIAQGDEQTRLKCLQYVSSKFVKAGSEVFTKEVEELIIKEIKKILQVRSCLLLQLYKVFNFAIIPGCVGRRISAVYENPYAHKVGQNHYWTSGISEIMHGAS